jgi:hypothetical protein
MSSTEGVDNPTDRRHRKKVIVDDLLAKLIPGMQDVAGFEKRQVVYSWDGKDHSQEPVKYCWDPVATLNGARLPKAIDGNSE